MKLTLIVEEKKPGLEEWFNTHAPQINKEFQKENLFEKIYRQMPRIVKNKVPFDVILSNKSKLSILDDYSIELHDIKAELPGCYTYKIVMNFNQNTLETFDIINMAFKVMPKWLQRNVEHDLCQEGTHMEDITRDRIVHRICKDIEFDEHGNKDCVILKTKVE